MDQRIDSKIVSFMEHGFHLQTLRYVASKIDAVKLKFGGKNRVKFAVFALALNAKITIFRNCSWHQKYFSGRCFAVFLIKMVRSTLLCRLSGGPFGQKISFNANVFISKIDPSMDTQNETSTENELHLQTLGYVASKSKAVESKMMNI